MPITGTGWEMHIVRKSEQTRGERERRRTVGTYNVFHNGKAVAGLSGTVAETRGLGDNSEPGNKRRIKGGQLSAFYAGWRKSTSQSASRRTAIQRHCLGQASNSTIRAAGRRS